MLRNHPKQNHADGVILIRPVASLKLSSPFPQHQQSLRHQSGSHTGFSGEDKSSKTQRTTAALPLHNHISLPAAPLLFTQLVCPHVSHSDGALLAFSFLTLKGYDVTGPLARQSNGFSKLLSGSLQPWPNQYASRVHRHIVGLIRLSPTAPVSLGMLAPPWKICHPLIRQADTGQATMSHCKRAMA
jgi:hypothetical protein